MRRRVKTLATTLKSIVMNLLGYLANHVVNKIPCYLFRNSYYALLGLKIGNKSSIKLDVYLDGLNRITIGSNSSIGRCSYLDGRGYLNIGNNVSISPHVFIITASHNINCPQFSYSSSRVEIDDYVWIGTRAMIKEGVKIGKGAVVAMGSIVTKNVAPYSIVAGIPARVIGLRDENLDYKIDWMPPFN